VKTLALGNSDTQAMEAGTLASASSVRQLVRHVLRMTRLETLMFALHANLSIHTCGSIAHLVTLGAVLRAAITVRLFNASLVMSHANSALGLLPAPAVSRTVL
jgi:predicted secreted protein